MTEHRSDGVAVRGDGLDWEWLRSAEVRLWQGDEPEIRLLLNGDIPGLTAHPVTIEPYSYRVSYVDQRSQVLEGEEGTAASDVLPIRGPFGGFLQGRVILSRNLSDRDDRALVTIRYRDSASSYIMEEILDLHQDQRTLHWMFPILGNDRRTYSYRVEHETSGDLSFARDWTETDSPTLIVGPQLSVRTTILALLRSTDYSHAKVVLSHESSAGRQQATLLLQEPFSDHFSWEFFPDSTDRRSYRYQVTLYTSDGEVHRQPERESNQQVLVIVPPGAEPTEPESE